MTRQAARRGGQSTRHDPRRADQDCADAPLPLQVPPGTAISYADTVQLAGAAAAIATGLPKDMLWKPLPVSRVDSPPLAVTAAGTTDNTTLLPPANLDFGQASAELHWGGISNACHECGVQGCCCGRD